MIVLLTLVAVARVTRLITTDKLTEPPRNAVVTRLLREREDGTPSPLRTELAYLVVCDWCASMYVGAAAAGAYWAWGETIPFMLVCLALAASYATGFLASVTNGGD